MLGCLLVAQIALAAEVRLEPGGTYPAGTRVVSAELGVALDIPPRWVAALPIGSEALILGSESTPGMGLITASRGLTLDDITEAISGPQVLDPTLTMTPNGVPQRSGNTVAAVYAADTERGPFVAFATGVLGSNGTSSIVFVAGPKDQTNTYEALVKTIVSTLAFADARQVPTAKPPTGTTAARLGNKKLTRLHTVSGRTEKEEIWLCADGRMSRNAETAGFDMRGFSAGSQGYWPGVWTLAPAQLILTYGDGSATTYEMAFTDGKLTLNGDRFYREDYTCAPPEG